MRSPGGRVARTTMGLFKTEVVHLESPHRVSVSRTLLGPHGDLRGDLLPASLCSSGLAGDSAIRPFQPH